MKIAGIILGLLFLSCDSDTQSQVQVLSKIKGLSFVAPPKSFGISAMKDVKAVKADWIAVIPYAFTRLGEAKVHFNPDGQWWGERPEGVRATIDSAHKHQIKVMLKPQVYVPQGWTGDLDFESDHDWEQWEKDYEVYLLTFAAIAIEKKVEMFCIGTELEKSVTKRPDFWRQLIKQIRLKYKGKLIYAANWDDYKDVPFWNELDLIGVNAYFPLSDAPLPTLADLQEQWQPILKKLRRLSNQTQKPVAFTEFGYLSVDGCAGKTWELEKKRRELSKNEQTQAIAYEALFSSVWNEKWWAGGFVWKWYPEQFGREGHTDKDYTPQNKQAEKTLTTWFDK
jgi:hypothetical protein